MRSSSSHLKTHVGGGLKQGGEKKNKHDDGRVEGWKGGMVGEGEGGNP